MWTVNFGTSGRFTLEQVDGLSGIHIKGRKKIRIPNPHGTGDIDVSLVKEILRQAGISHEEWNKA